MTESEAQAPEPMPANAEIPSSSPDAAEAAQPPAPSLPQAAPPTPPSAAGATPPAAATPPDAAAPATPPATPDAPPPAEPAVEAAPSAQTDAAAPEAVPEPALPPPPTGGIYWGTGRRKSSVARVRIRPGSGKFLINMRELGVYFPLLKDRNAVSAPLERTGSSSNWDVFVNVRGGGYTGQSGAILLGVSRALVAANEAYEPALRDAGYLTRDARRVERKKYGHRKARRSFQFSKR